MLKDSPTRLRRLLNYIENPPYKRVQAKRAKAAGREAAKEVQAAEAA
jgi:hypothetical protein